MGYHANFAERSFLHFVDVSECDTGKAVATGDVDYVVCQFLAALVAAEGKETDLLGASLKQMQVSPQSIQGSKNEHQRLPNEAKKPQGSLKRFLLPERKAMNVSAPKSQARGLDYSLYKL